MRIEEGYNYPFEHMEWKRVVIEMSPTAKEQAKKQAREVNRTLSDYIRQLIIDDSPNKISIEFPDPLISNISRVAANYGQTFEQYVLSTLKDIVDLELG